MMSSETEASARSLMWRQQGRPSHSLRGSSNVIESGLRGKSPGGLVIVNENPEWVETGAPDKTVPRKNGLENE